MEELTFTDHLDQVCDSLTGTLLQVSHLREVAPPELAEMTNFHRLEGLLEVACEIAEQTQSVALLGERLGEDRGSFGDT